MTDQPATVRTLDEVRACGHTEQQHRHLDATRDLAADLEHTRAQLNQVRAERDEALSRLDLDAWDRITAELGQARRSADDMAGDLSRTWDALTRAGLTPTAGPAELVDQLTAELGQARSATTAAEREHGEALGVITDVWAALNAAGTTGSGSPADHIQRLTADRDRLRRALDAARDGVELIDRALSSVDGAPAQTAAERTDSPAGRTGQGDGATDAHRGAEGADDSVRLADALEHAESARIDVDGDLWRPAPGGQWTLSGTRHVTLDEDVLEHMHGPTRPVLIVDIWLDEQDEQDQDAPLGSGPDRAQGQQAGYEVVVTRLHHDNRSALQSGDTVVSAVVDAVDAVTATDALAQVQQALDAPEPIRPADWERKAIGVVREALDADWAVLGTGRAAEIAVRAIIDAGLAGPGGRCPACGSTYPRTVPAGQDPRCWTCSTEPDPAELDEHRDTVARVLDNVRNGRPANTPTEG